MTQHIPKKQLEALLSQMYFSEKEISVYMVLMEKGRAKPADIMNLSGLKRGITYAVLYSLEARGLIKSIIHEKKTYFQLESPHKLLELFEQKKEETEAMAVNVNHLIPQLVSQYKLTVGKPTIQYYEGISGLMEVFEDIYAPKEDIVYGCVDLNSANITLPKHIEDTLIPKRIANKVKAHTLLADDQNARELKKNDTKQLRKSVLINKEKYPMPAEIDIYEDKIAMMSFKKGEFISIVIENKEFAQTLRSVFKKAMGE